MIKIGLIGLGGMGTVHFNNFKHIDGCEVVAAVGFGEKDQEKANHFHIPMYGSITEMIKAHHLDAVDICTPTFLHYEHVKEALENQVHVICEKPLSLKRALAEELFDLAKTKGKHLYVAHVVQFMNQTTVLRDIITQETYGKPLDAYFERLSAKPNWGSDSWMFDKEKAGLLPFDLHIHDLDLIVSLFGKPKETHYTSSKGLMHFPEHIRLSYTFDSLNVVAEAAWFNANIPFTARWRVYFEKGYLVNDGSNLTMYPADGDPIVFDVEEKIKIETGINVPPTGMYLNELEHFVLCMKENTPSQFVTRTQVLDVLEILESIKV